MLKYSFEFGGVDMRERFGLIVERFHDVLIPALRPRKLATPGRDGAYDFGASFYDEREITIDCATAVLSRSECRALSAALAHKSKLVRWDEPDKYYVGRLYAPIDIERLAAGVKRFSLAFICDPFACGNIVDGPMPTRIEYGGTARTPTRIQITNTGDTPIEGITIRIRRRGDNY